MTTTGKSTEPERKSTPTDAQCAEWLSAFNADEWSVPLAPGRAGALLAELWDCTQPEALARAILLMQRGELCAETNEVMFQLSYDLNTSAHTRGRKRAAIKDAGRDAAIMLVTVANAPPETPLDCSPFDSMAVLLLVAFGAIEPRDFEMFPGAASAWPERLYPVHND